MVFFIGNEGRAFTHKARRRAITLEVGDEVTPETADGEAWIACPNDS